MREENLLQGLEGICVACRTEQQIQFSEQWHLNSLYKIGDCPACAYEHSIFVKKC